MAFTFGTLALMLTAVTLRQGHEEFPGPALLFFSGLAWLPLLMRTRWPLAVLVATVVAESLHLALVPFVAPGLATPIALAAYQPVPVATMVAAFTVATQVPRRTAWIAGGSARTPGRERRRRKTSTCWVGISEGCAATRPDIASCSCSHSVSRSATSRGASAAM
jgi:hypothetical protein